MMDSVTRTIFGKLGDGTTIELLTIRNMSGIELGVINYGCIIASLSVPDSRGATRNVVLGYDLGRTTLSVAAAIAIIWAGCWMAGRQRSRRSMPGIATWW